MFKVNENTEDHTVKKIDKYGNDIRLKNDIYTKNFFGRRDVIVIKIV